MSAQEYGYWEAEYRRHPWGDYVNEIGPAVIASTIANVNRGKDSRPFSIKDFMVLDRSEEQASAEEVDPQEFFEGKK